MSFLQLHNICFSYAGQSILQGVSVGVGPGKRIGLVGPNGAGKSTLISLMAGEAVPDEGQISALKGKKIAQVKQSHTVENAGTLWDVLAEPFAQTFLLRQKLSELEEKLAHDHDSETLLKKYDLLQEEYTRSGGYQLEASIRRVSKELGFDEKDNSRAVATFSGGERMRVELAKQLLSPPDLLFLDEPTNHLDIDSVEALEERLRSWPSDRSFVLVSHDRYFLQAVCQEIWEIENKKVIVYPYGYTKYLTARKERFDQQQALYEMQQKEIDRVEDFIRRNLAGQNTKQAQSRRTMLEKLERIEKPVDVFSQASDWEIQFGAGDRPSGKEVCQFQKAAIGYPGLPPLIAPFTTTVYRGERIGIVGKNGSGKSTLIKTILGYMPTQTGTISLGAEAHIAYFDQVFSQLNLNMTALQEIQTVRPSWNDEKTRTHLGAFLFSNDDVFKKVAHLSGGERSRLLLAKQTLVPCNVLIMDEPTNHLDLPSCEILEQGLLRFTGTVFVISHDRYFLDRVVQKIWHIDPEKKQLTEHLGDYTSFRQRLKSNPIERAKQATEKPQGTQLREVRKEQERKKKKRIQLEQKIAQLEMEIRQLQQQQQEQSEAPWQELQALHDQEQQKNKEYELLVAEWMTHSDADESI